MSASFEELFSQIEQKNKPKDKKTSSFDQLFEQVSSKQPSRTRSIISAPIKGLIKGAAKFSPLPSTGPIPRKLGERITEELLPTQEKPLENILEFTGENIPLVALGEGGLIKKGVQAASGALAKKAAKDLELPEWAQEIVGSVGLIGPDIARSLGTKALRPSSKQKDIVDFLKSKGLPDKDITPIIQDKKKLAFLSKAASKYEKKDPWLRGIKNKLGDVFEDIRAQGKQAGYLEKDQLRNFEEEFNNKLDKVPRMYRRLIQKEVDDLMQNPIDFTELHDFNKAVNAIVGDVQGGKAAIGILKEPIEKAQKEISPSLFRDLQKTNESYAKLHNFTDKMTKKNWDNLVNLGQVGQALYGLLTLNPAALKATVSLAATKHSVKNMLTNPRLQNIHLKLWDSFLKNKIPQTLKLMNIFENEIKKKNSKIESND